VLFCAVSSAADPYNVDLNFPIFSLRNFTLLGDSYLRNGFLGLTQELQVPTSSSGSVVYDDPIPFFDPVTNATASFSTRFSFSVENLNPTSFGDGLAFFLSPENETSGGCLGLGKGNGFVAVEFDTKLDVDFDDPDDNHVGVDIDSLVSIKTVNPIMWAIDLKSGNLITVWIDYSNDEKKLQVFLSYTNSRPDQPVMTVAVDLSDHLKEYMFVGFSASTEGSTERHYIENWSFHTAGFSVPRPRLHSHNVSENTVPVINPPPLPPAGNTRRKIILGFGIGFPSSFCAAVLILTLVAVQKWRAVRIENAAKAEVTAGPRQFTYKELKLATRGFHPSRILGHGSFGTVYKAHFPDSDTTSAVKKSKQQTHEGKAEFLSELSIIACLRHKNLVQLQGWCVEKGELLLVYEFMPNGSLDKALYEKPGGEPLRWAHRYNIAVGLASALTYLHQECEQQVIHRDVKASNVMLDAGYNARLGDFGLARLTDHDKSPVSTLTAGTMGYLAPEYLQYGKATEKTDVFSYGVVVLELACGRRPIERERGGSEKMVNLVDWVWKLHSEGKILEASDEGIKWEGGEKMMKKLLLVGLSCANPDGEKRPSMRRVLQMLKDEAELMNVPRVKPTLVFSCSLPRTIDEIVSDSESQLEIRLE
ncbi:hypothetical protein M569_05794, partial [Genlisea aurea]